MNYASPEKLSQLATTDHRWERSLRTKIAALKEKLDNFTAVDAHGNPVGDIRNLVLNQGQLCLIMVQPDVHRHWRFVLLSSHLVQRVSLRDRVVFVHTTQADISYLPDHQPTALPAKLRNTDSLEAKLRASVKQLPAPLMTDRTHRLEPVKSTISSIERLTPQPHCSSTQVWDAPAMPKMLAPVIDTSSPLTESKHESSVAQAV